jgi:hypothetical protein
MTIRRDGAEVSIENIRLALDNAADDVITAPPERVLDLAVIGGVAHMTVERPHQDGSPSAAEYSFEVPATSLLRALKTVIKDDAAQRPGR